jgi:hypothetical protein
VLSLYTQILLLVSLGSISIAEFSEFKGYKSCLPSTVLGLYRKLRFIVISLIPTGRLSEDDIFFSFSYFINDHEDGRGKDQ